MFGFFTKLAPTSKSVAGAILWRHLGEMRVPSAVFWAVLKALKVWQALYFRDISGEKSGNKKSNPTVPWGNLLTSVLGLFRPDVGKFSDSLLPDPPPCLAIARH